MLWLIIALCVESVLLLWHLGVVSFGHRSAQKGAAVAGLIATSENELRRRGVDSLVWEKTAVKEDVYFYDSLLTLSQSTAKLKLDHGTEVDLAENTLVTLEPSSEGTRGEIRLRFTKGHMNARNPFRPARIEAPEFAVDLSAGSELQMREVGEGVVEMQMEKGTATVQGDDGAKVEMNSGRLLRMKAGEAKAVELDTKLKWKSTPEKRVYIHGDHAPLALSWNGEASELVIQKSGAAEYTVPVSGNQASLELPAGDYRVYPRASGGQIGAPFEIQVWKAPSLHLITPLPRNRVRSEETTSFIWTRLPEASRYVLKVRDKSPVMEVKVPGNSGAIQFDEETDALWSVWGVDSQGYMIPPAYEYPIYIRHTPLAAPKLKVPVLRKPASGKDGRGAWLWNLIFPAAYAEEEFFEAVFQWEAVEDAKMYVIEISESPDFRAPVVSEKITKTEFVWSRAKKRVYYWRVAGGGSKGRMGMFSEPAVLQAEEVRAISVSAEAVAIGDTAAAANNADPVIKVDENLSAAPRMNDMQERVHEPHFMRLFYRGGYQAVKAKAPEAVDASLSGSASAAFAAEVDAWVRNNGWWRIGAQYSSSLYKPVPAGDYPFQEDLSVVNAKATFTRMNGISPWGMGATVQTGPRIRRSGLESIEASQQTAFGFHFQMIRQVWHAEYRGEYTVLGGANGIGLGSANRFLVKPWSNAGFLAGFEVEAIYLLDGKNSTLTSEALFQIGWQF